MNKQMYECSSSVGNIGKYSLYKPNTSLFRTEQLIIILWTLHLYVATFQQHLYMEYISLSWYGILELVVLIKIFFL